MKPEFQEELERRLREIEAPPPPPGLSHMLKSEIPANLSFERKPAPVRLWSIWGLTWQYGSAVVMIVALSYVTMRLMQDTGLRPSAELKMSIPVSAPASPAPSASVRADQDAGIESNGPANESLNAVPPAAGKPAPVNPKERGEIAATDQAVNDRLSPRRRQRSGDTRQRDFAPELPAENAPPPRMADAVAPQDAARGNAEGGAVLTQAAPAQILAAAPAPVAARAGMAAPLPPSPAERAKATEQQSEKVASLQEPNIEVQLFASPIRGGEVIAHVVAPAGAQIKTLDRTAADPRFSDEKSADSSLKKLDAASDQKASSFIVFRSRQELRTLEKRQRAGGGAPEVRQKDLEGEPILAWADVPSATKEGYLSSELARMQRATGADRAELRKLAQVIDELVQATDTAGTRRMQQKVKELLEAASHR